MPKSKPPSCLVMLIVLSVPSMAAAQVIEGPADVIDGDSLRVAGTEVRLFGVDAPEFSQSCFSNGSEVACGAMAKDVLAGLIGNSVLSCQPRDTDTYGRIVVTCRTSGVDISEALVEAGWATAFRRYGNDYVAAEMRARCTCRHLAMGLPDAGRLPGEPAGRPAAANGASLVATCGARTPLRRQRPVPHQGQSLSAR